MTREPLPALEPLHLVRTVPVRRTQSRLHLTEPTLPVAVVASLSALVIGVSAGVAPVIVLEAAVAAVFAALILSDITVGLLCFGLLAFFENLPGLGSVSAAKAAGTLVAISWLATIAVRPAARRDFIRGNPWLASSALLFVAWMILSLTWADSASAGLGELGRYALDLLLFPIVYAAIRERRHVRWLIVILVAGATLSALYGMAFARGDALAQGTARLGGAGQDANTEAMLLVAGIALAVGLACVQEFSPAARVAAIGACLIQLLALIDTVSRGGLVGLAAVVVLGILLAGRRRRLALALAAVAAGLCMAGYYVSVASPAARARITTIGGGSGRVDIWTVAWRIVEAHPLNGIGVGNFTRTSVDYLLRPGAIPSTRYIVDLPEVAHNVYLQILAEMGVVGLLLFLAVVGGALWSGVKAMRVFSGSDDQMMDVLSRAVLVSLGGMLANDFFISDQLNKVLWIELALCPCLLAIARRRDRAGARPDIADGRVSDTRHSVPARPVLEPVSRR